MSKRLQEIFQKNAEFEKESPYNFCNKKAPPELKYDFETLSWYHTLLPAKLHRALCGFHEPASEGDISLYDAVAQFQICKKAITQSVEALQKISNSYLSLQVQIQTMLALLHNIHSRIDQLEQSIV